MAYPLQPTSKSCDRLIHVVRTEIGHLPPFDVVPHSFGGIEVGRITRQPLDLQPIPLLEEEVFHGFAAVSRQMIPRQDHPLALYESLQIAEEGHQALGVVTVHLGSGQ